MQAGDVPITYADTTPLERDFGFKSSAPLREGLRKFAEWYEENSRHECINYLIIIKTSNI